MRSIPSLQQQLVQLEAKLAALQDQGDYLVGVRIERTPAGGSASIAAKASCRYARLRAGRGKLLPNGKKSLYIPIEKIPYYQAACDRGKQVQQLERQIHQIKTQIGRLEQTQYRSWSGQPRKRRSLPQAVEFPTTSTNLDHLEIDLPTPSRPPAAILVLYRQSTLAPVHAVAAEIWQGNERIVQIPAVHCLGMRADKVTDYIKQLLQSLQQQFGISRFEDVVKEVPVHQCPIANCPLRG
ncbi:hypothetical protein ACN4EK_01935 [Pantanalinema rosaneae CENA516]|uniref:hypothetical protein n=1 Tax=Pantanalinema rosaneae TaxID=1620701 RepID=UPI003D6F3908